MDWGPHLDDVEVASSLRRCKVDGRLGFRGLRGPGEPAFPVSGRLRVALDARLPEEKGSPFEISTATSMSSDPAYSMSSLLPCTSGH